MTSLSQVFFQTEVSSVDLFYCVRGTRKQPLICVGCSVHYWVPCAINKRGFFEIAFVVVVDTHLPRFEALAYVLPHFDELRGVSSGEETLCRMLDISSQTKSFLKEKLRIQKWAVFNPISKHSTQCFITRRNTSKFVKNTPLRVLFSTLFSVFHLVMKHCIWSHVWYITS